MKIQLESLNVLIAAADYGSFSAAGRQLKKSQASISLTIQNLEVDLGFLLFNRINKYPTLTLQGEQFLNDARLLLSQYSTFIERSKLILNLEQIKLSIGIDPLIFNHDINKIIREFSIVFPFIELRLVQQNSESLAQKLTDKHLDFALGIFSQNVRSKFEHIRAFHVNGCWVASPSYINNINSENRKIDVINIDKFHFDETRVLLPTEARLIGIDTIFQTKKFWYVEDMNTLLSFCRNGLGIAYLPDFVVSYDLDKGSLKKLVFDLKSTDSSYCQASLLFPIGYQKSPSVEWLITNILKLKL